MLVTASEEEKYNPTKIDAYNCNQDGLALYWAERYINANMSAESER